MGACLGPEVHGRCQAPASILGERGVSPHQLQYKVKVKGQVQLAGACSDRPGKTPIVNSRGQGKWELRSKGQE